MCIAAGMQQRKWIYGENPFCFSVCVQTKKAKLDLDDGLEKEPRFVLW